MFAVLPPIESVILDLTELVEGTPIQYTGWALMGAFILLSVLVVHAMIYILTGIFGSDDKEIAIQREMARERDRQGLSSVTAVHDDTMDKAKRKIEEVTPQGVRLSQDGEFTDSFMGELQEQDRNRTKL
jgi:hypothetical protein